MNRKRLPSHTIKTHTPHHDKTTHLQVTQNGELLEFLIRNIDNKSRNAIKGLLSRGQISINNQTMTKYNDPLQVGDMVTIQWHKVSEGEQPLGLHIIYEDDDIIVIEKEAGLLSIAGGQETVLTAHRQLMDYVRSSHPRNRIYIVHRLDRDTSGIMLFAKNEKTQQTLQNTWQETVSKRSYVAVVEKRVQKAEDTIVSWLKETRTLKMYSSKTPNDGQKAITHYKVLQSSPNYSLLEIHLETGRKNQIRVHLQDIGHPIIGDKKYGSDKNPIGRLGLHAHILAFTHPTTGQAMRYESQIPANFLRFFK